jgi:hypothetical protein
MFQNKLTLVEQTIQKSIEKEQITMFNQTWFATTFRVVGEYFHNNFILGFQAHPLRYKGFGFGITFVQQRFVR